MNAARSKPQVFGWCPGALRPMESGDGLVVRVRTPLGRLSAAQSRGIAALSEQYGSGIIDLSARANLQLRGVSEATHAPLIEGLRDLGLIDRNIATETRRNVIVQPFWTEGDDTHHIAHTLTEALAREDAPDLPGKFGFAVDCGPAPLLTHTSCDIRIERADAGLILRADGAMTGLIVTRDTAAEAALMLARWFLGTGGVRDGRGRMKAHIARIGAPDSAEIPPLPTAPRPTPGQTATGALVALEFGQMRAETLAELATVGAIRLTPWRALLIEGADRLPTLPYLITDPGDPRLNISTCTGAPGCHQALSATRHIARTLAPNTTRPLHISGCAKGCAHPAPCAITLTATSEGRFDLIRDGRASDSPEIRDLSLTELLTKDL
ncbi:precorrin-3B synthase [Aliiroseovarius sp.]|uniref:precorrin-3B synthase n=1 Tax=Aliiroseovarius sp. TaxID=1872442 RepID=UPI003BA86EB4